jgi:hypothetical protein
MAEIKLGKFGIIDIESNGYSLGLMPGCNIAAELALRPSLNLTLDEVAAINALASAEWTPAVVAAVAPVLPTLGDSKESAIAKTYADVDDLYAYAVGNREQEYLRAEVEARAYKATGYTGTVSPYTSGWGAAQTPAMTGQQSADAIIAKADALAAAKLALRNTRFTSQAAMRAATTQSELDAEVAAWDAFCATVKAGL